MTYVVSSGALNSTHSLSNENFQLGGIKRFDRGSVWQLLKSLFLVKAGVELAGLQLHPLPIPFTPTPSTFPSPFPIPNYTAGDLGNSPEKE